MVITKKYIIFSVFVILSTFILINENLLPNRIEVAKTEIIEIIGIDYIDGRPTITIIRNNSQEFSGANEVHDKEQQKNVLTITSDTFEQAIEVIQVLNDKFLSFVHAEYILLGENVLIDKFNQVLDFLGHSRRVGLNANVFIIKNHSASEFMSIAQDINHNIKDRLDNMLKDDLSKAITKNDYIDDVLAMSLRENQDGVIPVLSIITSNNENKITDKNKNVYFFYDGLAVIQNMKLVEYIENEDTVGFNIIANKVYNYSLKVNIKDGAIIVGINNIITKPEYIFEDNEIKKIKYKIKATGKIEAFNVEGKLVSCSKIKEYEEYINAKVKDIIINSINKCFGLNVDYFYFQDMINRKNPYKYREMVLKHGKETFNVIKKAELEIDVESSVKISYDMINTNINQKGM